MCFRISAMSTLQHWIVSYAYGNQADDEQQGKEQPEMDFKFYVSKTATGKPVKISKTYSHLDTFDYIDYRNLQVFSGALEGLKGKLESSGDPEYCESYGPDWSLRHPPTTINVKVDNVCHAVFRVCFALTCTM